MQNNFKCPETGEEFFVSEYSTSYEGTVKVYKDKWRKPLTNPKNGVRLVLIERPLDWSKVNVMIGTGTDKAGIAKRNEQLSKRAKQHFKKEISEQKFEKNKELVRKYKNGE